ncbi:M20/M25/M40 family metallo-hydrolase [Helicobacter burdigaliensis]|uniref:M20/M25/M40 family metallo-hydrolase n=1 Tax=Helicobacter burdigaliensis TaxID=2315334 RepID=UPI000EF6DFC9|nr:M20/M25/M40 family metallo-hydrolase [Helicobacter burdigaliensis]
MQKLCPLDLFLEICKIPHSSRDAKLLKEWIIQKAHEFGAEVKEDKAGNVLCSKGSPKICLQGHYDMVYVGDNPFKIEPYFFTKEGKEWLGAKDSSLGADNGVAVACMLVALKESSHIECLFSADEEVGMEGARDCELEILSPFILNCDSEDISEIVLSCAGGYDLIASQEFSKKALEGEWNFFRVQTQNFKGGHSGVDIHKNIPNAIIELAKMIATNHGEIIEFSGGEKRNSIPVNASALVAFKQDLKELKFDVNSFKVEQIKSMPKQAYAIQSLMEVILKMPLGVLQSEEGNVVLSSNLGKVRQEGDKFTLVFMDRGNKEEEMRKLLEKKQNVLEQLGFISDVQDFYPPWEREEGEFVTKVAKVYREHNAQAHIKSIHAGLECGILKQKFPHKSFVSIGPTILCPHSKREHLDVTSFWKFWEILKGILKEFS